MIVPDNHNHFLACADINGMVAAAERAGVGEIAFTEHVFHIEEARALDPWLRGRFTPEGPPLAHADYLTAIAAAAAAAAIPVRRGLELEVHAGNAAVEQAQRDLRDRFEDEWDLVIGSVHVLDDDECIEGEAVKAPPVKAWGDYLERLTAATAGPYDVISHPVRLAASVPDVPPFVAGRLAELARAARQNDVALEVNGTDVQRRPDLVAALIEGCARHGTLVSLGSDAHRPAQTGRVLAALPVLRAAGIERVVMFQHRIRSLVSI